MRTDRTLDDFAIEDTFVSDTDLIGFEHPRDVVKDPILTLARKRQLLAFWGSDIHAVTGAPALRSYPFGPTVSIDAIQAALCELDDMVDLPAIRSGSTSGVAV